MTIHLPPQIESSIQAAVQSGRFASVDDAMTEAARRLLREIAQEPPGPRPPAAAPPLLGAMSDDAAELDEIVAEAMKRRARGPGRPSPVNKALLDTDILSEIIKGFDPNVARNSAAYYQVFGRFTLSAITVMEIVQGFEKNQSVRKRQSFIALAAAEEVIDFDQADGVLAGRIAGELDRTGRPIGTADTMIAAIALHHGLELVTGNTSHFRRHPAARLSAHPRQLADLERQTVRIAHAGANWPIRARRASEWMPGPTREGMRDEG